MPPDAAYAMSRVESEADRNMAHLVEDLLLLARLDSGPYLDLQPVEAWPRWWSTRSATPGPPAPTTSGGCRCPTSR